MEQKKVQNAVADLLNLLTRCNPQLHYTRECGFTDGAHQVVIITVYEETLVEGQRKVKGKIAYLQPEGQLVRYFYHGQSRLQATGQHLDTIVDLLLDLVNFEQQAA